MQEERLPLTSLLYYPHIFAFWDVPRCEILKREPNMKLLRNSDNPVMLVTKEQAKYFEGMESQL